MSDALKFEWVRLRTVRSTYWLIALAIVLPALLAGLVGFFSRHEPLERGVGVGLMTGGVALFPLPLPAVMLGILGVLSVGHEYRHGTIRPTLTALPHRSALVTAKLIVIAATSAVVAVVSVAVNYLLLTVTRGTPDIDGLGRAALVGFVLLMVLWGVLGVAGTLLTRQTALMLPLLFVLPLVVEPVLIGLTYIPALNDLQPATRFLPFSAGAQLAQSLPADQVAGDPSGPIPLRRVTNGAIFSGFVMLVMAPAWLLFEKRDA